MQSSTLQPPDLLHYNAKHRVLVCKECHYAIQPSAISRHLKDLHQIYRSQRREFFEFTQQFDLAEPVDVSPPLPFEPPVPFLPTEEGQECGFDGCDHLCMTIKRMKSHWFKDHTGVDGAKWKPVTLQTFFRGNQLRYFVVTPVPPAQDAAQDYTTHLIQHPLTLNEGNLTAHELYLLHHFQRHTSLTLGYNSETQHLWQTVIPEISRKYSFLKHGILAFSALHVAEFDPSQKCYWYRAALEHQNNALPEYRTMITTPNEENCHALLPYSQLLVIYLMVVESAGVSAAVPFTNWINQVRGSYTMLKPVWHILDQGPLRRLIPEGVDGENITPTKYNRECIRRLSPLMSLPFFGSNSLVKQVNSGIPISFPGAHMELARAYQIAEVAQERSVYTPWTIVCIWPARVSTHFLEQLDAGDSPSLILFAHFLMLMKPLSSKWYMRGCVKKMLTRVDEALDPEYKQWIQWPLEEMILLDSTKNNMPAKLL